MTLSVTLTLASRRAILESMGKLRQKLIDAEYVVEEKVENYEPGNEGVLGSGQATPPVDTVDADWVEVVDGEEEGVGSDDVWIDEDAESLE